MFLGPINPIAPLPLWLFFATSSSFSSLYHTNTTNFIYCLILASTTSPVSPHAFYSITISIYLPYTTFSATILTPETTLQAHLCGCYDSSIILAHYTTWQHAKTATRRNNGRINANIHARSCHHCCHGRAISITHYVCVCSLSYPACKAHAPYYIVNLLPAWFHIKVLHIIS